MSDKEIKYILFLEDIQTAIAKIEKYTEGLSFKEFCNFEMAVDAVLRNLEVIGEAVKKLGTEPFFPAFWEMGLCP